IVAILEPDHRWHGVENHLQVLALFTERLLHPYPLGDVVRAGDEAARLTALVVQQREAQLDADLAAILPSMTGHDLAHAHLARRYEYLVLDPHAFFRRPEECERAADRLLGRVPVDTLSREVPRRDDSVAVRGDH